jgi:hypothetical protein
MTIDAAGERCGRGLTTFRPDDQERLLGSLERLMTSTQGQDMGAFMDLVDKLFLLIDQLEAALNQEQTPRDIQAI